MSNDFLHLATPGEILLEEFIKPLGLTQKAVAQGLDIPESRLSEIINGKLRINAEYALRLSLYFRMSDQFWTNMQCHYDRQQLELSKAKEIRSRIKPIRKRKIAACA
jgi:addiction module antidote protein, HigA family